MTQEQDALPFFVERDEAGILTINGQLLRFEMFKILEVSWTDTASEIPLEYLEAAHRWILDGKLPGKAKLSAVR